MKYAPLVIVAIAAACASRPLVPARVDTAHDACAFCRMVVSDVRMAAQIVAAGEEPLIFDDIGCMRNYLAATGAPRDAAVFVADHRTGTWVKAERAVFTRVAGLATPMGSGILAHADDASRAADSAAAGGTAVEPQSILGGLR